MTNYERIKGMSVEEMALMIADEIPHGDCYGCKLNCLIDCKDKGMDGCQYAFYKWLKTEVKKGVISNA